MCDKVARAIRDRDEEKSYETERRQRTVLRGRGRNERLTKFALCREREREYRIFRSPIRSASPVRPPPA